MSGGLDSMAVAHYYLHAGFQVTGLFVNYGQLSAKYEEDAVYNISHYFNINLEKTSVDGLYGTSNKIGFIQGRNLLLLSIAISYFPFKSGIISIGTHSGTDYSDSTQIFLDKCQSICDLYFDGLVKISAPFIEYEKREIYQYIKYNKLPFDMTISCENYMGKECNTCKSCKDRELFYAS